MNELIFDQSNLKETYQISGMFQEVKIREIALRVYSINLEKPSEFFRRNILALTGSLYSSFVFIHRSTFQLNPTATNQIFVFPSYKKNEVK